MFLSISNTQLAQVVSAEHSFLASTETIRSVVCDTRRIVQGTNAVFFALPGVHSDGHKYISEAYNKGIRNFVVAQAVDPSLFVNANFICVADVMEALFLLTKHVRNTFHGKVILISGKLGKTSVKEWLYALLTPEFHVSRSPKSYNSNLGIMLSVLVANPMSDIVLIEVKPHDELIPEKINALLRPEIGILTSIENLRLPCNYFQRLFHACSHVFHAEKNSIGSFEQTTVHRIQPLTENQSYDKSKQKNIAIAQSVAQHLGIVPHVIEQKLTKMPDLVLRMETFEGENGNFIIYDLYNLDVDAFRNSLEFQKAIAQARRRVVIVGWQQNESMTKDEVRSVIDEFLPDKTIFLDDASSENLLLTIENAVILVKGNRTEQLKRVVDRWKKKRHPTELRIDLKSLRKNIAVYKKIIPANTKMMAMLKATGYGSGIDKIAQFIDGFGVDYFGVAFVDEGVQLRNAGIDRPIMVMNTAQHAYQTCIDKKLEPAIFDFQQLDEFIAECVYLKATQYPVHLKINTGMNRLGFNVDQIDQVLEIILSQPEVLIKSVYSHLAEAENHEFTRHQIQQFEYALQKIRHAINYPFETHILNTSGIEHFAQTNCSMVRLGIGMYGVASDRTVQQKLSPVVSWHSVVGQLRTVLAGQTIGYGRSYVCETDTHVAIIPIGYADGLPRMLSNKVGFMTINGVKCPIVGQICMDMTMVDVSHAHAKVGDEVEIIGMHCSLQQMAELQQTIPYEVMTSVSERVHKVFIE